MLETFPVEAIDERFEIANVVFEPRDVRLEVQATLFEALALVG